MGNKTNPPILCARPAFGIILLAIEKAYDPFSIPGVTRQSTLACRVGGLAADFSQSRPQSPHAHARLEGDKSLRSGWNSNYPRFPRNFEGKPKSTRAEVESIQDEHFVKARKPGGDLEKYATIQPIGSSVATSPPARHDNHDCTSLWVPERLPMLARPQYPRNESLGKTPLYRPLPPSAKVPAPPPAHQPLPKQTPSEPPSPSLPQKTPSGAWGREFSQLIQETGFSSSTPCLSSTAAWSSAAGRSLQPKDGLKVQSGSRKLPSVSRPKTRKQSQEIRSSSQITSSQGAKLNVHQLQVLGIAPPHFTENGPEISLSVPERQTEACFRVRVSPEKGKDEVVKHGVQPQAQPNLPCRHPLPQIPPLPYISPPGPIPHVFSPSQTPTQKQLSAMPPASSAPSPSSIPTPRALSHYQFFPPAPSYSHSSAAGGFGAPNLLKQAQANLRARKKIATPPYSTSQKSPLSRMNRADEDEDVGDDAAAFRKHDDTGSRGGRGKITEADLRTSTISPSKPSTAKLATTATLSPAKARLVRMKNNRHHPQQSISRASAAGIGASAHNAHLPLPCPVLRKASSQAPPPPPPPPPPPVHPPPSRPVSHL